MNFEDLANTFPAPGSSITTRISQGFGASFCLRQCIIPVIGNHPLSGTSNAIIGQVEVCPRPFDALPLKELATLANWTPPQIANRGLHKKKAPAETGASR
jgi:hypothetical protein